MAYKKNKYDERASKKFKKLQRKAEIIIEDLESPYSWGVEMVVYVDHKKNKYDERASKKFKKLRNRAEAIIEDIVPVFLRCWNGKEKIQTSKGCPDFIWCSNK